MNVCVFIRERDTCKAEVEQPNLKSVAKSFLVIWLAAVVSSVWAVLVVLSVTDVGGTEPFQHLMVSLKLLFSFLRDGTLRLAPKMVVSDFFKEPKPAIDGLIGNARLNAMLREREREREREEFGRERESA